MKSPTNASGFAGLLARPPRVAIAALMLVLVLGIGIKVLVPHVSDDTHGGTIVSPAFQRFSDQLALKIASAFTGYHQALDELTTNPDVAVALSRGNDESRAALAAQLTPKLDGVLALRILPADFRDPIPSAHPPLSYASISMLNRSREEATDLPMEAHLGGTPDEHLVILKRVTAPTADGNSALIGFLHLALNLEVVRKAVADNPLKKTFLDIRQVPGNSIAANGRKPNGDVPSSNSHIPNTRFVVTVASEGAIQAVSSGDSGHTMLLPVIALLLACGAAIIVLLARHRSASVATVTSADAVIYSGAIKAILEGAHPGLELLLPSVSQRTAAGAATPTTFSVRADAEADDITMIKSAVRPSVDEDPTVPGGAASALNIDLGFFLDSEIDDFATDDTKVGSSIFRAYDIRGIVGQTLTEEIVYEIGRALGAEAEVRGQKTVVVARDGRHSSEALMQALASGLLQSGRDVLDIGLAPTPVLYFATNFLDARSGVMITGSHNPVQYNGLKIVLDGQTLSGEAIQAIRRRVEARDFIEGAGSMQSTDIVAEYIRRISEEIPVSVGDALKIVVDCGNAVPGMVAPAVLRAIGHDVVELFCDLDGDFPNHHPDPSQPENLRQLIDTVLEEGADLGLAFDGDGDRLGVVDSEGNIIWPDRQMILFSRDILSHNPGAKVIYDVKCSRHLPLEIVAAGGEAILSKTGHSIIKNLMRETGALLAGELSGHLFFRDRWYGFDDALYAAARLLEILVNSGQPPSEVFAALPGGVSTPELRLAMPEARHAQFMDQVMEATAKFEYAEINVLDGMRADFVDSWGLIRPSNTTPCLTLRFEGDDAEALEEVQGRFRKMLKSIDASLKLPF